MGELGEEPSGLLERLTYYGLHVSCFSASV